MSEVGRLAEPFEPQAGETAADIAVQWTELESSLDRLSHCYGHAAADWMGIEAELDDIQQWCSNKLEWTQHSVTPGEEDETLAQIQVCNFQFFLLYCSEKKREKKNMKEKHKDNHKKLFSWIVGKVNY